MFFCSLAFQEAGALLHGGSLSWFLADIAACLLVTGESAAPPDAQHMCCNASCGLRKPRVGAFTELLSMGMTASLLFQAGSAGTTTCMRFEDHPDL